MDLIDNPPKFDIYDTDWSIFSRNTALAPQYVGVDAKISDSTIAQGSTVCGNVSHSVVFSNVQIGEGSQVSDSVIMPGVKIGKNVTINKAVIGADAVIGDGATIGICEDDSSPYISGMCTGGIVLIEGGALVPEKSDIPKCAMFEIR